MAEKNRRGSSEKAWMLDESVAAAADGATIAGFPGIWRPGEAVHPEAFGMGVAEFRDVVERLNLPLVEVSVREGKAAREFVRSDDETRFGTETMGTGIRAETGDGPAATVDDELAADGETAAAAHAAQVAAAQAATDEEETS